MLNRNYRNEIVSFLFNKNKNFIFIEPIPTMPQKRLFVLEKLKVVEEAAGTGNVGKTAREWNVYPSTICIWRENYEKMKKMAEESPRKLYVHTGIANENTEVENAVCQWIIEQCESELAVSTVDVIKKQLFIDPQCKINSQGALFSWFYRYSKRYNLSLRTRT